MREGVKNIIGFVVSASIGSGETRSKVDTLVLLSTAGWRRGDYSEISRDLGVGTVRSQETSVVVSYRLDRPMGCATEIVTIRSQVRCGPGQDLSIIRVGNHRNIFLNDRGAEHKLCGAFLMQLLHCERFTVRS